MGYKNLVLDIIHEQGLKFLSDFAKVSSCPGILHDELMRKIDQCQGVIVKSGAHLDSKVLSRAVNLKVIGKAGSGLDNIDLKTAHLRKFARL